MRTTHWLSLVMAALLGCTASAAEPELRGTPGDLQHYLRLGNREVRLVGHAQQTVQADVGHVSVVVHTQARDLTAAIAANAQRRQALAQSLQSQGIDAKAIRAEKFSSSPQYGWFGKAPNSFDVNNRLIVDVTDERQLMIVTGAASSSPELSVGAISFEYSKQRELEEQVRRAAFDDALSKKAFYEQRLGATMRPADFEFSDLSARGTAGGALEEIVVTGTRRQATNSYSAPDSPTVPSFDEKDYQVSVTVTFAVEPGAAGH